MDWNKSIIIYKYEECVRVKNSEKYIYIYREREREMV